MHVYFFISVLSLFSLGIEVKLEHYRKLKVLKKEDLVKFLDYIGTQ